MMMIMMSSLKREI